MHEGVTLQMMSPKFRFKSSLSVPRADLRTQMAPVFWNGEGTISLEIYRRSSIQMAVEVRYINDVPQVEIRGVVMVPWSLYIFEYFSSASLSGIEAPIDGCTAEDLPPPGGCS